MSVIELPPETPPLVRPRVWLYLVIPLLAAAVLAGLYVAGSVPARERAVALGATVERQGTLPIRSRVGSPQPLPGVQPVSLVGSVTAIDSATVRARIGGTVATRDVSLGDEVKAGQILFTVEDPVLVGQIAVAEAVVGERRAVILQSEARLGSARGTQRRSVALGAGVISQQDLEDQAAAVAVAEAEVVVARARLTAAEAERDRLVTLNRLGTVTAPLAGTVTRLAVERGDLIPPNGGGTTEVVVTDLSRVRVRIDIPQATAGGVVAGLAANLQPRGGPPIATVISRTSGALGERSRALAAELDVAPDPRLPVGAAVTVSFSRPVRRPGLRIPSESLVVGVVGSQVAVLDEGDKARLVPVVAEGDDGTWLTIASGLAATDRVLLNPSGAVEDGRAVVVLPDPPPPAEAKTSGKPPGSASRPEPAPR